MLRRGLVVALGACALVCAELAACDNSYSAIIPGGDASSDASANLEGSVASNKDAATPDANAVDAGPCNLSAPFSTQSLVPGLPPLSGTPHFSEDELTVYFAVEYMVSGASEIVVATRPDLASAFGTATPLTAVNVNGADQLNAALSYDQLRLVYASTASGGAGSYDIWVATRPNLTTDFAAGQNLAAINSAASDEYPYPTVDGELFFSSTRGDGVRFDVWHALVVDGGFETPTEVNELSSAGDDIHPVVSFDKLTAFVSQSSPSSAASTFAIFVATRPSVDSPFGSVSPVSELNTTGAEKPSWLSTDSCRLYFTRAYGDGGAGGEAVAYVASRPAN